MEALFCFFFVLLALASVVVIWWAIHTLVEAARSQAATHRADRQSPKQRQAVEVFYRTQDSEADYGFTLERLADGFRIYVVDFACERAKGAPHLLHDRKGPYVCWSCPIETKKAALAIAATWADNVQQYLKTGQRF